MTRLLTGKGFALFAATAVFVGSVVTARNLESLPTPTPAPRVTPQVIYVTPEPLAPPTLLPSIIPTEKPEPTPRIIIITPPPQPSPSCFRPGQHRGVSACLWPHSP